MKTYLAVDIGASSGRHILGLIEDGKLQLKEVFRFKNGFSKKNGHRCWDIDALQKNTAMGIRTAFEMGFAPESVAIDTWGVDFVLLDSAGRRITDAVAYRDSRTKGVPEALEKTLSFQELYAVTGIQKQPFNTVYQLLALQRENLALLQNAAHFLMTSDYLSYTLTDALANEYTICSTTALLNAAEKTWDFPLIKKLGLPEKIFHPLKMAGEALGTLTPTVQAAVGGNMQVRLAPSHDTASAFLAVPARDENAVFLSSGTWSLIGVELSEPITTPESAAQNFTNEGGYGYRYRFLQNIMGLWMLQSIRRELGEEQYSFQALAALALAADDFPGRVDVNDASFLAPDSMCDAVRAMLSADGYTEVSDGEMLSCVYHSLAQCYANAVRALEKITGKTYSAVHIVGGGSQDDYLNRLTANATGLPVFAGPTEGTAIGNLVVQMIADGTLRDVSHAREIIRASFPIRAFQPERRA